MSERSMRALKAADKTQAKFGFIRFFSMTLFGWFFWYLLPKMSQEFPTASLDIRFSF